jgi:hypothetical protein
MLAYRSSSEKMSATMTNAIDTTTWSPPPMILNSPVNQISRRGSTFDHSAEEQSPLISISSRTFG